MNSLFVFDVSKIGNFDNFNGSQLKDRAAIIEVVNAIATLADLKQWSRLKQLLAEEVTVDYTSLFAGEIQNITSNQLISQWQSVLPGFDATQHTITNHHIIIDANKATAIAYVRATHKLNNELWIVSGYYIDELIKTDTGWKIKAIQYNAMYEEGDRSLLEKAVARVAAQNKDK